MKITEISRKTGLGVRQLQRLAREGKIPGVRLKTDGYHHTYQGGPDLLKFISAKRQFRKGRLPAKAKNRRPRKLSVADQLAKTAGPFLYWYNRNRSVLNGLKIHDLTRIKDKLMVVGGALLHVQRILERRADSSYWANPIRKCCR